MIVSSPRVIALINAAVLALAAPVALAASHAHFWQNRETSLVCGYRTSARPATQLICSAKGIPRPKGVKDGDGGFVVLGARGRAKPIVTFQSEFPAGTPVTLANGTTWMGLGITCSVGAKVTCRNKSRHGFTIGRGRYKAF